MFLGWFTRSFIATWLGWQLRVEALHQVSARQLWATPIFHVWVQKSIVEYISYIYIPTSPRASQSMSFAEMGLKGRCAEGLFNAEHSTAECLWKCRWIYGRGICRTISLSPSQIFSPFHTLMYARIVSRYVGKQNCREQAWAIVSKALKGTCKGPKRYVKALKGT